MLHNNHHILTTISSYSTHHQLSQMVIKDHCTTNVSKCTKHCRLRTELKKICPRISTLAGDHAHQAPSQDVINCGSKLHHKLPDSD